MYGHRPIISAQHAGGRFAELVEALKAEYDVLQQDLNAYKLQREELEAKMQAQLNDMSHFQKNIYELERAHLKMKQQYDDEIGRLRGELDGHSGKLVTTTISPPNLEGELISSSGASLGPMNLPPVDAGHTNGSAPKRGPDEPDAGRNVRPRDDSTLAPSLPYRRNSGPSASGRPPPVPNGARPPPSGVATATQPTKDELALSLPGKKDGGYDWLVVYNPKIQRSISVDLVHNFAHESVVCCVRFSPDGKLLATGGNKVCHVYSVDTGDRTCSLSDSTSTEGDLYVRSVSFSADGKLLVSGSEDHIIRIWDLESKQILHRLTEHEQDIYSLEFLPHGTEFVSGSGDRTLRLWDAGTGKSKRVITVDHNVDSKECGVTSVAVSADGKFVAAGSLDRLVRVWDLASGRLVDSFEGHRDSVYSVAFSPDQKTLISGSLDKTLKVWEFDPSSPGRSICKHTILGHKDFVLSVAYSPDGHWIVSGSKDRSVQFWNPVNAGTQLMLQGHKNSVINIAMSPVSNLFATGSGDCRARIWSYSQIGGGTAQTPATPSLQPPTPPLKPS